MKEIKLILTLEVDYELGGATVEDMKANLEQMVKYAMGEGVITGDSPATVKTWDFRIDQVPVGEHVVGVATLQTDFGSEEADEPEKIPLTEAAFVEYLRENAEAIDPEEAFREVCLEQDDASWRALQRKLESERGSDQLCKLEVEDRPAFRQGLNDYADSMQKENSWVTFDNGGTYFTADDIKEAIAEFENRPETYVLEPKLKDKISFWL